MCLSHCLLACVSVVCFPPFAYLLNASKQVMSRERSTTGSQVGGCVSTEAGRNEPIDAIYLSCAHLGPFYTNHYYCYDLSKMLKEFGSIIITLNMSPKSYVADCGITAVDILFRLDNTSQI